MYTVCLPLNRSFFPPQMGVCGREGLEWSARPEIASNLLYLQMPDTPTQMVVAAAVVVSLAINIIVAMQKLIDNHVQIYEQAVHDWYVITLTFLSVFLLPGSKIFPFCNRASISQRKFSKGERQLV